MISFTFDGTERGDGTDATHQSHRSHRLPFSFSYFVKFGPIEAPPMNFSNAALNGAAHSH
jgi:hypothetical protein